MGLGRAGHHALGLAAVRVPPALALAVLLGLGGCKLAGAVAGAAAGASTGAATANPIVGYAVAVAVNSGVDELQDYISRSRQHSEQDAIVAAVGQMQPGDTRSWEIVHDIPLFDDHHGVMQVTRDIATPLTDCKEVLFTIDEGSPQKPRRSLFTTAACRDTVGWQWAQAEPAVERWGYLQHISH